MKRIYSMVVVAIFLLGIFCSVGETTDPSQVVAKVNEQDILQSEVDSVINMFVLPNFQAQNPGQEMPADQKAKLEGDILNRLVTEKLLLQVAADTNVTIDEEVLNQRLETAKTQRPEISEDEWKDFLTRDLLIQKTIEQEVVSKLSVSDEEVLKYYEENKEQFKEPEQVQASHILVQVAQDATDEEKEAAKQKINEVYALVKEGQDFAELAKEYSDCPSKEEGGDLGLFPRGAMVKPFEDVAFAMNEGDISDIIETQFGYHIIMLTGKQSERDVPLEEVQERLQQTLLNQKTNTEVTAWVEELKSQATIEMLNQ